MRITSCIEDIIEFSMENCYVSFKKKNVHSYLFWMRSLTFCSICNHSKHTALDEMISVTYVSFYL